MIKHLNYHLTPIEMKHISLIFFISLCIIGCSTTSKNESIIFQNEVEILPADNTLRLSDIFKKCEIISLRGQLLSSISDVFFNDSLLVIKGNSATSSLHLFNNDGQYIKAMIDKGRGSNEAINIQAFRIDDTIAEVLINFSRSIITYSLPRKHIVSQFNLPEELLGADDFIKLDENRYAFYKSMKHTKNDEYKISVFNKQTNKIEKQYFPLVMNDEYISFAQLRNFYYFKNRILFYEAFAPGIYQLTSDSLTGYIHFDKKAYDLSIEKLKKCKSFDEVIEKCKNSSQIWGHTDVIESKKFILSTFWYKDDLYLNLINKANMTSQSFNRIYDDLITDSYFGINEGLNYIGANDNFYYFILEPYKWQEIINNKKESHTYEKYKKEYPTFCSISDQLKEDDNSLLILFYD